MALELKKAFGPRAQGSAYFNRGKLNLRTVAEVPPKTAAKKHHSIRMLTKLGGKTKSSSGTSGSGSGSKTHLTERQKRPLFNFKTVPHDVTEVGIRKRSFRNKHHGLLSKFANAHPKIRVILVVNTRGPKPSETNLRGLKHNNVFMFSAEHNTQVFPKKATPPPRHSSSKGKDSKRPAAKGGKPGLKEGMKKLLKH